jgi:hypothetical protein
VVLLLLPLSLAVDNGEFNKVVAVVAVAAVTALAVVAARRQRQWRGSSGG